MKAVNLRRLGELLKVLGYFNYNDDLALFYLTYGYAEE